MDKNKLIKLADKLNKEAFDANSYFLIIKQYRKYFLDYSEEIGVSPAFYSTVYDALGKACFVELAKLYDESKNVLSIGSLLKECHDNTTLFPAYQNTMTIKDNGRTYTFPVPYQHYLKPEEECFFKDQVKSQRKLFEIFDNPSPKTAPVQVNLTFQEFLTLYQKRFRALSKKRKTLREQRNKKYVHNDADRILNESTAIEGNVITLHDVQELIDFALDCTGLILGVLTDIAQVRHYSNVDDLKETLMLVRLGLKYQDYDIQQEEKVFEENIR